MAPESKLEAKRTYHREYMRRYVAKMTPEQNAKRLERMRRWKQRNPDKVLAYNQKHKRAPAVLTEEELAQRRAAREERKKQTARAWRAQNAERMRAHRRRWVEANKQRDRESKLAYKRRNPARHAADERMRLVLKRRPASRLHDQKIVRAVYEVATAYRAAGFDVHVDHVVPLRGKTVSGLHVPANLAIVFAAENYRKSNKFQAVI